MIIAENINKIFRQGTRDIHAVRNADLGVDRGERVFVRGPSGAGKSTLLQVLGGLSRPTGGRVTFRDMDIYGISDGKRSALRNGHFGFVFQFYHLLPELSVVENVMLPALIRGGQSFSWTRRRAAELLKTVGMADRMGHRPAQLSGGEAQRTAIARALVNAPDVLFCDEPTGNLDSKMSKEIYSLIRGISEAEGMSVIVVSHQTPGDDFFRSEYIMTDGVLERVPELQNERI